MQDAVAISEEVFFTKERSPNKKMKTFVIRRRKLDSVTISLFVYFHLM